MGLGLFISLAHRKHTKPRAKPGGGWTDTEVPRTLALPSRAYVCIREISSETATVPNARISLWSIAPSRSAAGSRCDLGQITVLLCASSVKCILWGSSSASAVGAKQLGNLFKMQPSAVGAVVPGWPSDSHTGGTRIADKYWRS